MGRPISLVEDFGLDHENNCSSQNWPSQDRPKNSLARSRLTYLYSWIISVGKIYIFDKYIL